MPGSFFRLHGQIKHINAVSTNPAQNGQETVDNGAVVALQSRNRDGVSTVKQIHVTVMADTTLLIRQLADHTPVDGILHCRPEEPLSMRQLAPTGNHFRSHGDEDNRQR